MKSSAYAFDFLFGHHHDPLAMHVDSSFAGFHFSGIEHESDAAHTSSSFAFPALGGMGMMNPTAGAAGMAAPGQPPAGANGYNQFPADPVKGINPAAEIARINGNIALYNAVIGASAVALGITMCLFVRSVMKPPKGVHGGDSDDEMDSEEDDEDESDSDDD